MKQHAEKPAMSIVVPQVLSLLVAVLMPCLATSTVYCQGGVEAFGNGGQEKIQGRIYFPSGRRSDILTVKVTLESSYSERLSVIADQNGSFIFQSLTPGSYRVTVDAGEEYEVARETIVIDQLSDPANVPSTSNRSSVNKARTFNVLITLKLKNSERVPASVINAKTQGVPKPALEAFENSLSAASSGDHKKAVDELNRAIAIDPNFQGAFVELGVQYLKLSQAEKAVEALQTAVKLDPEDILGRRNLGIALLMINQVVGAETQLRYALAKKDSAPTTRLYLGITLIKLKRYGEALPELELAIKNGGQNLALAQRYLGGLYLSAGRTDEAIKSLERYLQLDPQAPDAERIRGTVKELRGQRTLDP